MRERGLPALAVVAVLVATALAIADSDAIRARSSAALGRGVPAREAELARGFVLGEDDRIDRGTVEDFRRAGLSHLLAVSGQNVALLILLAIPLLAALGMPLRTRLVWVLGLIAAYVPLAGAGASIQRAAVMGILNVLATLVSRRTSRWYALAVAALLTLAIDPAVGRDVGWQLSFAAVVGILLLAQPLRSWLAVHLGLPPTLRPLVDVLAMTVAATLATAPLIAFHFGELSTTTLLANLLAAPAVAPAMWLGMASVAAGQVPGFPVEVLNCPSSVLLAYVAQVAEWCGGPSWAFLHVEVGAAGLIACYGTILATLALIPRVFRVLRRRCPRDGSVRRPRVVLPAVAIAVVAALFWIAGQPRGTAAPFPPNGLRITILDVGQGDAILLQPPGAPAVLVDGGPPGDDLAAKLDGAGVEELGAAIVTHDQSDHDGGLLEALGAVPIGALLYGRLSGETLGEVRAAGIKARRVAAGGELRLGTLRLEVLWPPRELLGRSARGEDPNRLALVVLVRWRQFSMLLGADAEAETTPLDPGPLDVLKVAHHGSEDGGLAELLERTTPRLAVISVGEGNPYGHPTPATLSTLAGHGVGVLRTDRDGTVVIDVSRRSLSVRSQG